MKTADNIQGKAYSRWKCTGADGREEYLHRNDEDLDVSFTAVNKQQDLLLLLLSPGSECLLIFTHEGLPLYKKRYTTGLAKTNVMVMKIQTSKQTQL